MSKLFLFLLSINAWAACTPDARGICVTGLTAIQDNILGPLIPYGNSPWSFFDAAEKAVADNMAAAAIVDAPALGTALSGTVSYNSGDNFFTTTADLRGALASATWMIVAWDSIDGAGTGRLLCPVNIGASTSTTIVCYEGFTVASFSGKTAYQAAAADAHGIDFTYWTTEHPSFTWNYYDVAIALYRLYYRTGTSTYQTWARAYADYNWQWNLDHGYRPILDPRAASMISQFFRALDGHSERFPGLYNWINHNIGPWADPSSCPHCDARETGYMLWNIALGAKTDPDATRHAQYCSWLSTYTTTWNSKQNADGSWSEYDGDYGNYVDAPLAFTLPVQYGGAPWRQAINVKAMEAAYESLNDTGAQGCNNTSLAASTLTVITKAVTWENNYGRSTTNRGIFYEVNSQSNSQLTVKPSGTVSINTGSTALTGSGTTWNTDGYCDGTHFILIGGSVNTVYKIASCSSNTAATITPAYNFYSEGSNVSGGAFAIAPAASTSCGSSSATYCYTGASNGDRNLTRTVCGGEAWLYAQTGNATYKTWSDECVSATLGGPSAGLTSAVTIGNFVTPCSGPACDGYVGEVVTAGPNCTDTGGVAPCTYGGSLYGNLGKNFGEAFGAPGIDNALAWRLWFVAGGSTVSGKAVISGKAVH